MAKAPAKLEPYRRKRDFRVTPEPPPKAVPARSPGQPLTFMVHKHDATRLHYDLRLELGGALASWAVPKGPSHDPRERRLAVRTEDHPLEYGAFEGRIPDGEYGAGDALIWDRGTWDTVPPGEGERMRAKGHLLFELHGEKLHGRWHLVRTRTVGGKEQWLLFKGKDEFATPGDNVVARRPESVASGRRVTRGPVRARVKRASHPPPMDLLLRVWPPMLATLAKADDARGKGWVHEVKYDGFRALAALSGGALSLQSRNGLDLSARFPAIAKALGSLDLPEAVLDGEIVALDRGGVARFEELQGDAALQRFAAFDVLWLDGEDVRGRPLEDRRELLESALANAPPLLVLAERLAPDVDDALAEARARGLEGVLSKRLGSPYRGARGRDWLKLKLQRTQEVAIVGYLPITTGAKAVGALLAAVVEGGRLRFAGKVGTGFTDAVRRALWKELEPDHVDSPPVPDAPRWRAARWCRPRLVAQVAFTEWTRDGRLRHPSFKGLRADKSPDECVLEEP